MEIQNTMGDSTLTHSCGRERDDLTCCCRVTRMQEITRECEVGVVDVAEVAGGELRLSWVLRFRVSGDGVLWCSIVSGWQVKSSKLNHEAYVQLKIEHFRAK